MSHCIGYGHQHRSPSETQKNTTRPGHALVRIAGVCGEGAHRLGGEVEVKDDVKGVYKTDQVDPEGLQCDEEIHPRA